MNPYGNFPDDRFSDAWFAHVRANLKKHWAREDEEKRLLGGIDEETLACYHLGLSTPQERQRVDDAMEQFPAIGEALELLRQVDAEWQDEGASGITDNGVSKVMPESAAAPAQDAVPLLNNLPQPHPAPGRLAVSNQLPGLPCSDRPDSTGLSDANEGPSAAPGGASFMNVFVAIAVVAVLITALLPGFLAMREAARRAQCTNNLFQIAVAIQNYMATEGVVPLHQYGYAHDPGPSHVSDLSHGYAGNHSWYCGILPHVDHQELYNALNMNYTQGWVASGNVRGPNPTEQTVISTRISAFLCPSDGVVNTASADPSVSYPCGNFNYVANAGQPRNLLSLGGRGFGRLPPSSGSISMSRMYAGQQWCDSPGNAAYTNLNISLDMFFDGISNTAGVSESLVNDGSGNHRDGRRNLHYTTSGLIESGDHRSISAVVQDGLANPINKQSWSIYKGHTWAYSDARQRHVYAHLFPPNSRPINTYHDNTFRCQEGDSGMCPTSNHPGGVNIAFMDGSVRFVKNSVSFEPWWSIGTRNGGETVTEGEY